MMLRQITPGISPKRLSMAGTGSSVKIQPGDVLFAAASPEKTRRQVKAGLITTVLTTVGSLFGLGSIFCAPSLPSGVKYTADDIVPVLVQANHSQKTTIPEVNRGIDQKLGDELHTLYFRVAELGDDAEETALHHLNDPYVFSLSQAGQAANKELVAQYRALHISDIGQQPEAEKALLKAYSRKVIDAKASPQIVQRYDELIDSFYSIRHSQQGQTAWQFFYIASLIAALGGTVQLTDKWMSLPKPQNPQTN